MTAGFDVAMTIGPWTHTDMVTKASGVAAAETLTWLGAHLAKRPMPQRSSRVRVYVTHHGWVNLEDWPPPPAKA